MSEIKYNETQIQELLNNKYVKNVTKKSITFSLECKAETVKLAKKYMSSREIFKKLWFPEYIVNSKIPEKSLDRWKRNLNKKWVIEEKKWRPKLEKIDFDNLTKDQYIEYLETKLAYYEEMKKYIDSWFS